MPRYYGLKIDGLSYDWQAVIGRSRKVSDGWPAASNSSSRRIGKPEDGPGAVNLEIQGLVPFTRRPKQAGCRIWYSHGAMKTSHQANSVHRNQNALIRALFERAGDLRKVLCVALDYAKRKHLALICDGRGDILKAAFPVENNTAGIDFLIEQISATARRRKIP